MNKKVLKAGAFILATALTLSIAYFANGLVGNPISRLTAQHNAERYINEKYPDENFVVDNCNYSFKDSKFNVQIKDPKSMDKHFYLSYDFFGNLVYDSYEYYVLNKANTMNRIWMDYKNLTEAVMDGSAFPLDIDFGYGEIRLNYKDSSEFPIDFPVELKREDLVIDKLYDVRELGKDLGVLILYVYEEDITPEKMAEDLLLVKRAYDESGVPFFAVEMNLREPKEDNKTDYKELSMLGFLYSDITDDENLLPRVKEQIKITEDYYNRMDSLK